MEDARGGGAREPDGMKGPVGTDLGGGSSVWVGA